MDWLAGRVHGVVVQINANTSDPAGNTLRKTSGTLANGKATKTEWLQLKTKRNTTKVRSSGLSCTHPVFCLRPISRRTSHDCGCTPTPLRPVQSWKKDGMSFIFFVSKCWRWRHWHLWPFAYLWSFCLCCWYFWFWGTKSMSGVTFCENVVGGQISMHSKHCRCCLLSFIGMTFVE